MVDMAHFAGLVAGGAHPSPVPHADFVTLTTHKTMRGPWGGVILCRSEYADQVDKAACPNIQGGPQMHAIAAKAVMFKQCAQPAFRDYAQAVVTNAKAMAAGPDPSRPAADHRRHRQPSDGHRPAPDRPARTGGPGCLRRGGRDRQRQRLPRARGIALQPQRDPARVAVGRPRAGWARRRWTRSPALVARMLGGFDDPAVRDEVREASLTLCRRFPLPYRGRSTA